MTDNTSATGGPLTPAGEVIFVGSGPITFDGDGPISWLGPGPPPPVEDDALDDFFQALATGITGMNGSLIRPRYQAEPPNIPDFGTDWCALGIVGRSRDTYAAIQHDPVGDGWDRLTRSEDLDLLVSFYGPHCQGYATMLDDGLMVAQNREAMYLAGIELTSTGEVQKVPELIKQRWLPRADIHIFLRRQIVRYYPVRSLISASADISAPPLTDTVTVAP